METLARTLSHMLMQDQMRERPSRQSVRAHHLSNHWPCKKITIASTCHHLQNTNTWKLVWNLKDFYFYLFPRLKLILSKLSLTQHAWSPLFQKP